MVRMKVLSASFGKACASTDNYFPLSLDFHEWWCSMLNTCLISEGNQQ